MTSSSAPNETVAGLNVPLMTQFVMDGYLEFTDLVPEDLNAAVHEDQLRNPEQIRWSPSTATNAPNAFLDTSAPLQDALNLPRVQAILASLLGPGFVLDHSYLHVTPAGKRDAQKWHVDHDRSGRHLTRDDLFRFNILIAYFTHEVPAEMGPTLVLPGSHVRDLGGHDLSRYRNIVGQKLLAGPGGRIAFMHDSMWHCAQPNLTSEPRFMFKARYHPTVPQHGHFDTAGWDSPEIRSLFREAAQRHPWQGTAGDQALVVRDAWWKYLCRLDAPQAGASA